MAASNDFASPPSSSLSAGGPLAAHYNVFLSRGPYDFVDRLYRELKGAGIPHIFRDEEEIHGREGINATLIQAIEQSNISIPIIFPGYRDSEACLMELAHMLLCRKTKGHKVIPLFYLVEPSILNVLPDAMENKLGRSTNKLAEVVDNCKETIKEWKTALSDIAQCEEKHHSLSKITNRPWRELISEVVSDVKAHLMRMGYLIIPDELVGIIDHVKEMMRKLGVVYHDGKATELHEEEIRVVTITGSPGIGKTTLAKVVFDNIQHLFQACSILENIDERLQSPYIHGIERLQQRLISDLNKQEYPCSNYNTHIRDLKTMFRETKALIILDGVRDSKDIKALAAESNWFGPESRIILTSDVELQKVGLITKAEKHKVDVMPKHLAIQLFHKHAYGQNLHQPLSEHDLLAEKIIDIVTGNASVIKAVGSCMRGEGIDKWKEMLAELERSPPELIYKSFEVIYNLLGKKLILGDKIQQIFLDIACFLDGKDPKVSEYFWRAREFPSSAGINCLCNMCWVKIKDKNKLQLPYRLQIFGQGMVKKEHKFHGMHSRLWNDDAKITLKQKKGTAKVEALCLGSNSAWNSGVHLKSAHFKGFSNLKYLRLNGAGISGDFKNLLSELLWLEWCGCPRTFEATNVHLEKLVVLDLSWSNITEHWQGWTEIQMLQLKVLNLTGCDHLSVTPKFYAYPSLEILILEKCYYLRELDPSIVTLEHLVCLNLKFCQHLCMLPDGLGRMKSLEELLIDQTSLREIPGLVGDDELEALRSLSTQYSEAILPQEVTLVHDPKLLKIFDRGSICIKRSSKKAYPDLTGKLVGIDQHVQEIMRKLDIVNLDGRSVKQHSKDVRVVQICGMPGTGKTTLAKVVYNKIRPLFPYCTFLEDVSENAKRKGIMSLQGQLLTDLRKQERFNFKSSSEATFIIKHTFRSQRVLIVLDDVNNPKQIHPFMQNLNWFGPGSKIIITTRHQRSFFKDDRTGVIANYCIGQMRDDEALRLFKKHTTGYAQEENYHSDLSGEIISVIEKLPLAIEVVALHLYLERQEKPLAWTETLIALKTMESSSKFQKAFKVSFNSLREDTKNIFLDIACFLVGKDKRFADYLYMAVGSSPKEIDTLCDLSLVEIGENNDLWMHGKLRSFGREVASRESTRGSARLWNHKDALSTLRKRKGRREVVALALKAYEQSLDQPAMSFTCEDFRDLKNLWFLKLGSANIYGDFQSIMPNLRWLDWQGCLDTLDVTNLHLENLIILELSWSKITQNWNGWNQLEMINLKVLNLTGCKDLLMTPNLSHCQCLEMLILEGCIRLAELHPSISDLKFLVSLNLKSCSGLNTFPETLDELGALKELFIDGTSIHEIPSSIGDMKQLKIFSASCCTWLSRLPDSIGQLVKLQKLSLRDCCRLVKLPDSIGEFRMSLKELDVSGTAISRLPDSITNLQNLRVLRMDSCFITEFPHNIGKLTRLEEIHASWCIGMQGPIPNDIGKLKCLRILRLQHSTISSLPTEIEQLSNLQALDLFHCDMLQEFPRLPTSLTYLHVNPELCESIANFQTSIPITDMVQPSQPPHHPHSHGKEKMIPMQVEEEERSSSQQVHKGIQKEKNEVKEEKRFNYQRILKGIWKERTKVKAQLKNKAITDNKSLEFSAASSSIGNRSGSQNEVDPNGEILEVSNLKVFSFSDLKIATRNFRPDTLLGEGGFGKVFKGWIDEKTYAPSRMGSGMAVAVKKLNPGSMQGFDEWRSEVNFLGRLSHPNLVKLLGYCWEAEELFLVYEFMGKGSLENHLFRRNCAIEQLSWDTRLKIATGAARGLAFLHSSDKQVILGDVKASNILLDWHYNAKISDFEFAKLRPSGGQSHVTTRIMGTYGYAAPEYIATGHLYIKSDVYGFGVILLELLTGLRAIDSKRPSGQQNLVEWTKPFLSQRGKLRTIIDRRMEGPFSFKAALETADITLACLALEPRNRPSMREVVETLERIRLIKDKPK